MASTFGITADRHCRIRAGAELDEEPFPLDVEGFLELPEVASSQASLVPGALVRPLQVAAGDALVLLGEPGVGKSTTFEQIRSSGGSDLGTVVWLDGADVSDATFDDLLGRHLQALPAKQVGGQDVAEHEPGAAAERLTLIIDQADESPIIRRLASVLKLAGGGRDPESVRVLLACRTADYPDNLTKALTDLCGGCVLADLAPLTRADAVALCDSVEGVNGEAVVQAAAAAGAGSLASVPLTLGLLVQSYKQVGYLEGNARQLFPRGIEQLLDERKDRRDYTETSLKQRLVLAGRAATRLLLSGRHTIWLGPALEGGPQDLNADSLAGGVESVAGGVIPVTKSAVLETLSSGLFTGRGAHRLAFRHGSMAAYLAARYLCERELPQTQLEALFLVVAPDGARTIPTLLRETAAWLVTLDNRHADWLVAADPESLVAHSSIVDSDQVRKLIVDSLLSCAGDIELGHRSWRQAPRRVSHPGLETQLLAVLQEAQEGEPSDWNSQARVRLAVRLARESEAKNLAAPLLAIAESDAWSAYTRVLAARTAAENNPEASIERLRRLLTRFADPDYGERSDPDDELLGSLLEVLYPEHVAVEEILPYLRPRRNQNFIGSYFVFVSSLGHHLPDEDVGSVLDWAQKPPDDAATVLDDATKRALQDDEMLEGLLDRALIGPRGSEQVDTVARILLSRLRNYEKPPLPVALTLMDDEGLELPSSIALRRSLALAFCSAICHSDGKFDRADVWHILREWGRATSWQRDRYATNETHPSERTQLLVSADLEWAYHAAEEHDSDSCLADALSQVAAALFDPEIIEHAEFVYGRQQHPAWRHLEWWFQAVPLAGEYARMMRPPIDKAPSEVSVERAEEIVNDLKVALHQAIEGKANAYVRLIWNLQMDPSSGQGPHRLDDDVRKFPGFRALGDNAVQRLAAASARYLSDFDDRGAEWLGTAEYYSEAWAGYLALALLARLDMLSDLPEGIWSNWVSTCVWFPSLHEAGRELRAQLLADAARHAPGAVAEALLRYARGEWARNAPAIGLAAVDLTLAPELTAAGFELLQEVVTAWEAAEQHQDLQDGQDGQDGTLTTPPSVVTFAKPPEASFLYDWGNLVSATVRADEARAAVFVRHLWAGCPRLPQRLAATAVATLLEHDVTRYWNEFIPGRGREVVYENECGRTLALIAARSRRETSILNLLDEAQLVDGYRWLQGLFSPASDARPVGPFVSDEQQARDWRDDFLSELADRATDNAVLELAALVQEFPDRLNISSALLQARRSLFAGAWTPPRPDDLARLLEDAERRLVRSPGELAGLILDTLKAIERDAEAHNELLWDRVPKGLLGPSAKEDAWLPKPEAALCAYLTHEIRIRLQRRGLAVNREVLVRPTNAYGAGDRTDILVEATVREDERLGPVPDSLIVVIEAKGCWNAELLTAQRDQLALRYLHEINTDTGIYLVSWYPVEMWSEVEDGRRAATKKLVRSEVDAQLVAQAREILRDLSSHTIPISLRFARPFQARHQQMRNE